VYYISKRLSIFYAAEACYKVRVSDNNIAVLNNACNKIVYLQFRNINVDQNNKLRFKQPPVTT